VAIAFAENGGSGIAGRLGTYDRLFADNLLEAEFRSALAREGVEQDEDHLLSWITWVFPPEALSDEYLKALTRGQLRGADLRHVACAAFLARLAGPIDFLSLDDKQCEVAAGLGLTTSR
jgi:hypothetical protein